MEQKPCAKVDQARTHAAHQWTDDGILVFCAGIAPRIGTREEYEQKKAKMAPTGFGAEYMARCDDGHRNYVRLRTPPGISLGASPLTAECTTEGCERLTTLTLLPDSEEERRQLISKLAMEDSGYTFKMKIDSAYGERSPELQAAMDAAYRNALAQEEARLQEQLGLGVNKLRQYLFPGANRDASYLVVDDITKRAMQKRIEEGIAKTLRKSPAPEAEPVSDPLRDAYEQALDLAIALRQLIKERDA